MLFTHPRTPSSPKPTARGHSDVPKTPLMVLITKMMMVTSRAQSARSHHLSPEGQARASRRQGLDRGQLWTSDGKTDVDDAATQVACVTTGSGELA